MDIPDDIIDLFGREISRVSSGEFKNFKKEVPFIKKTIETLDDVYVSNRTYRIWSLAKKFHSSPIVDFELEHCPDSHRASAELADLIFVVNYIDGNISRTVQERLTSISQSKKKVWDDSPKGPIWEIKKHQFYLLDELPAFSVQLNAIDGDFNLTRKKQSFTTYSLVGDEWLPFFHSTSKLRRESDWSPREWNKDEIYNKDGRNYDRKGKKPGGVSEMIGFLKMLIRGKRGQVFDSDDDVSRLYKRVLEESDSFDWSNTGNRPVTDGGNRAIEKIERKKASPSPNIPGVVKRLNSNPHTSDQGSKNTTEDPPDEPPNQEETFGGGDMGIINIIVSKSVDPRELSFDNTDDPFLQFDLWR